MALKLHRPLERLADVQQVREAGTLSGERTGFKGLDYLFTAKRGFPLFVAGAPHHGKSIFAKQLAINMAKSKGWKICLYMGEEGSAVDLVADLLEMWTGKDLRTRRDSGFDNPHAMTDEELIEGLQSLDRHFRILCPDEVSSERTFTLQNFQDIAATETFDMTVLDPWNDLDHDVEKKGGREDLYLADALRDVRRACRTHNRLDVVVTHIAKVVADKKTNSGKRYQGPAQPSEWAGGQTWSRRAFTMLLIYRPPVGEIIEDMTEPIEPGECWVYCQKTKPKGVGHLGRVRLWWDPDRHRFTERDQDGHAFASFER